MPADPRFHRWFCAMPRDWQEGLWVALEGGVAECVLLHTDRSPAVHVYFVAPEFAPAVEQVLKDAQ